MKLVVGYDGSDHARRALEKASGLAGDDTVVVVSVVPTSPPAARGPAAVETRQLEVHHDQLQEAKTLLAGHGVQARLIETLGGPMGDVADALMHVARDEGADLIVVGARGLNVLQRLVLGSVTDKLVHEAEFDVLVVH
jgi:nucleotide-binding universal stress UspA family protein